MEEKKKRFNHRHVLCWLFFLGVAAWSFFVCRDSYIRLFYSVIDFGLGLVYAIFFMYEWCPIPDVNAIKGVDIKSHFPSSWEMLSEDFDVVCERLFSRDNFVNYMIEINPKITLITQLIMLATLLFAVYLIVSIFITLIFDAIFPWLRGVLWLRTIIKLLLVPVICGLGYELIKICGRYDNIVTRIIAAPGLWIQRITVKEPDDSMIEVAIAAMTEVIPENEEDDKW